MDVKNSTAKFVSSQWLADHLADEQVIIIDATIIFANPGGDLIESGYDLYQERHIPGAIFANLLEANQGDAPIPFTHLSSQEMADYLGELGLTLGQHLIIYDSGPQYGVEFKADSWASRLAWQLENVGFKQVSVLEGGINKWLEEGRPVQSGINTLPNRQIKLKEAKTKFVDQAQVIEALENEQVIIIDVLDEAQFKGETYPFGEHRAGHIPGAKNIFYGDLTEKKGALKNRDVLRKEFISTGAFDLDREIIVYCGFGVAATYVARVLEALGHDQVFVYDGSLQEWAENESLPLER